MSTNNPPDYTFGSYNSSFFTNEYVLYPLAQGNVNFVNTLYTKTVNAPTDVDIDLYAKQTTGVLTIGGNTGREGDINIGNQSTVSNTINIGSNLSKPTIFGNVTINPTSIAGVSLSLGSTGGTIYGNNITNASPYYITCGGIEPAFILDRATAGQLSIGTGNTTNILITPPLSAPSYAYTSVPTTLLKANIGYYVNYPVVEYLAQGNSGNFFFYNPIVNTATTDSHYLNAGHYIAYINFKFIHSAPTTAVSGTTTLNICYGSTASSMGASVAQVNTAGPVPSPATTLIKNPFTNTIFNDEYTHVCSFYLPTASYVNLQFNLSSNYSITNGTMSFRFFGNIRRIG